MLGTPFDVTGEVLPPFPLSSLPHSMAVIHKDGNVFRRRQGHPPRAGRGERQARVPHVARAEAGLSATREKRRAARSTCPRRTRATSSSATTARPLLDRAEEARQAVPGISFLDILEGNVDPELLRGKILLVGTLSKDDSSDFAFTPYSKASFTNPKLARPRQHPGFDHS